VVIDDREIFANRECFPGVDEVIVSEFEKCFDGLDMGDSSYIVIVTRGHLYDGLYWTGTRIQRLLHWRDRVKEEDWDAVSKFNREGNR
jgi:hypothetical protein